MFIKTLAFFALASTLFSADRSNSVAAGAFYNVIPQIAAGGVWKTTISIANLERAKPVDWTLRFYDPAGRPLPLSTNRGHGPAISGSLAVHGSIVVETDTNQQFMEGWALLETEGGDEIGGLITISRRHAQSADSEAVVPLSSATDDDFVLPFDNSDGFSTSIALTNPGHEEPSEFYLDIFDEAGTRIDCEKITIPPGHRQAFSVHERFPVTAGMRGTISTRTLLTKLSVFALRFNAFGSFTSLHTLSRQ